jgi:flagellar export protein FliJ
MTVRRRTSVQAPAEQPAAADHPDVTGPQFRFRLERVRTVRKHSEDAAAQELAIATSAAIRSEHELRAIERQIAEAREASLAAATSDLSGEELRAVQAWLESAGRELAARREAHRSNERGVAICRAALTEAATKRKALDRLEVRRRDEFDRDASRAEVRRLDEIALSPHAGRAA